MADQKKNKRSEMTVLVVEDEPSLQDIYVTKLAADGFKVIAANNGVEALNMAVQHLPTVILLDIVLPLKDGFQVLQDLKLNPKTKDIPVIILSNLGQTYEVKRGMSLGAAAFLSKSNFLPAQVIGEINRVLGAAKGGSKK